MTYELNTNVLPVVSVDLYSRIDMFDSWNIDFDDFTELDEAIIQVATPIIQDCISDVLPGAKITPTGVNHPKYYNFATDELDFTISVDNYTYEELKQRTLSDSGFAEYLKEYRSSDGFISYMASDLQEFEEEEDWRQFCQIIMYHITDGEIDYNNSNFEDELLDYIMNYTDLYYDPEEPENMGD